MYPLIPLLIFALALESFSRLQWIPPYLAPPPSAILQTLFSDGTEYWHAAQETLLAALLGLFISAVLGLLLSLIFSSSRFAEKALYPYAVFFQTVPLIAIAPILVIWFGFGMPTVVACSVIASIFPVIANAVAGLWSTDKALIDIFKLYGASNFATLFRLRLPYAVPQIFTGLRIASGLAMIGAIVGEFIAGGGLGGLIDMARTQQRLDKVFAAVLIASFSGILLLSALNLIAKLFFGRWPLTTKEVK